MLPIGQITGHRGTTGALTVRVPGGPASLWNDVGQVWIRKSPDDRGRAYTVERASSYKDRLVLKLDGIDDPTTAGSLRGARVFAPESEAPPLADGEYWNATMVGIQVLDEAGRCLGEVTDLMPTGGPDLLVVRPNRESREEILIPMAPEIVLELSPEQRRVVVRLPEGLEELNSRSGS